MFRVAPASAHAARPPASRFRRQALPRAISRSGDRSAHCVCYLCFFFCFFRSTEKKQKKVAPRKRRETHPQRKWQCSISISPIVFRRSGLRRGGEASPELAPRFFPPTQAKMDLFLLLGSEFSQARTPRNSSDGLVFRGKATGTNAFWDPPILPPCFPNRGQRNGPPSTTYTLLWGLVNGQNRGTPKMSGVLLVPLNQPRKEYLKTAFKSTIITA